VASPADLAKAHRILTAALRVLMGDLQVSGNCARFRPTLLVGPAGSGKSRLVRRLAEICGLRINRYDAASASDSSFGGTARRWSTGEPCFALNAILANRTPNGIILVDELDKCGSGGNNGEFANTLLPLLESETSCRYPDPYTQSECDLSFLSFIATVNDDRALPGPLRDRFRLLRIPAPTLDHLPTLARGIVADIAAEQGGDPRFFEPLNDGELAIAEGLWRDGSVRRLRAVIERLLARRESHPRH
jgi:ATP-dependent Lon protease